MLKMIRLINASSPNEKSRGTSGEVPGFLGYEYLTIPICKIEVSYDSCFP